MTTKWPTIGIPISITLFEIILHNVEKHHILKTSKHTNMITHWHRYVDDTLHSIKVTKGKSGYGLNNIHKNLQFTVETEKTISSLF